MSLNKFVSLPILTFSRSKIFLGLITGLHLLALTSVTQFIYFHFSINIIIGLLVCFSFYCNILYYKQLSDLKMIKCRQDGMWILGYESKPLLVSIEADYMITEWLIVLHFKIGQSRKRSVPIFKDMLPKESFKQLRVALPFILNAKLKSRC